MYKPTTTYLVFLACSTLSHGLFLPANHQIALSGGSQQSASEVIIISSALDHACVQPTRETASSNNNPKLEDDNSLVQINGRNFFYPVNWPATSEDKWKSLSRDLAKITGITRFSLFPDRTNPGRRNVYTLRITTTEEYSYEFFDRNGDGHVLEARGSGERELSVSFYSTEPTIKYIRGRVYT